jgi:hypothetical protein
MGINGNTRAYNLTQDIYFDIPQKMKSRGCIKVRYFENEPFYNNFACIDFDLKSLFQGLEVNPDVVQLFLVSDDSRTNGKNDLNMIYWSKMYNNVVKRNPTDEDTIIIDPEINFNRKTFEDIKLSPDTLLNGLYYNILDRIEKGELNSTRSELITTILGEYNSTIANLKQIMKKHSYSECEDYVYKESNITTEMTYGNLYYNTVTKKEGIFYINFR